MKNETYSLFFPLENSLGFTIYRTALHMKSALQRTFKRQGYDITTEQWSILLSLWERDGLTQQEIADKTYKDKANITRFIGDLERAGYLARKPDPADGRKYAVYLTPRGRELRGELMPIVRNLWKTILRGIPARDVAATRRVLTGIFENLS